MVAFEHGWDRELICQTKRTLAQGTWKYVQDYADAKGGMIQGDHVPRECGSQRARDNWKSIITLTKKTSLQHLKFRMPDMRLGYWLAYSTRMDKVHYVHAENIINNSFSIVRQIPITGIKYNSERRQWMRSQKKAIGHPMKGRP